MSETEKRRRRVPRKITPSSLENGALHYLERFATSSENLRQVLSRRVARAAKHHDLDAEQCAGWIDDLIRRYLDCGLLDDGAYARAQAASMNRRGKSLKAIRLRLRQKAVAGGDIDDALAALAGDTGEPDFAAALAYARRRRLGPYRRADKGAENRDRELAALARNGFSYFLARRIVEAEDPDELEQTLAGFL